MAQDFLNQSDRDVQRLVEDLEDVIRSPLETDMATVKQARFINLLLKVTKRFFSSERMTKNKRLQNRIPGEFARRIWK